MEHQSLLFNVEKPNKFGMDTTGFLNNNESLNLYYVLDGHSKHPQSSILVRKFQEHISNIINDFEKLASDESEIINFLRTLITNFHLEYQRKLIPGAMSIIIAVFTPTKIITAHMGDCRLGQVLDNHISWITMPHNLAMLYLDRNFDIETQLKQCEYNHIVTRSLNTKTLKEIEFNIFDLESCKYLLASDGVWKLENKKILSLLHLKDLYFSTTSLEDDMALTIVDCFNR